jgi:hypothetical protein
LVRSARGCHWLSERDKRIHPSCTASRAEPVRCVADGTLTMNCQSAAGRRKGNAARPMRTGSARRQSCKRMIEIVAARSASGTRLAHPRYFWFSFSRNRVTTNGKKGSLRSLPFLPGGWVSCVAFVAMDSITSQNGDRYAFGGRGGEMGKLLL